MRLKAHSLAGGRRRVDTGDPMSTGAATGSAEVEARACRRWSISEPAANCLATGFGLVLALGGAPLLVMLALRVGKTEHVAACAVYGLSLILLYAASTHYHVRQ